jgi:hypothetical protein
MEFHLFLVSSKQTFFYFLFAMIRNKIRFLFVSRNDSKHNFACFLFPRNRRNSYETAVHFALFRISRNNCFHEKRNPPSLFTRRALVPVYEGRLITKIGANSKVMRQIGQSENNTATNHRTVYCGLVCSKDANHLC